MHASPFRHTRFTPRLCITTLLGGGAYEQGETTELQRIWQLNILAATYSERRAQGQEGCQLGKQRDPAHAASHGCQTEACCLGVHGGGWGGGTKFESVSEFVVDIEI